MKKHVLDARLLEPPEPFMHASAILRALKPSEFFYMIHRRVPYPLIDLSNNLNIEHRLIQTEEQDCVLVFFFAEDLDQLKEAPLIRDLLR